MGNTTANKKRNLINEDFSDSGADNNLKNTKIVASNYSAPVSLYLYSRSKRATDIALASIGLLLVVAIFPIVGILVKLNSPGPVLYRQIRLGLNGRSFRVLKFRTMIEDAEVGGHAVWAVDKDPRVTRIGRILRNLYIDELPQWWNVMRGEMSAVGPRPERPELASIISKSVHGFSNRLVAKPGITGLAQVSYRYGANVRDARNKFRFDNLYNENASYVLDVKIIVQTFRRILMSKGT